MGRCAKCLDANAIKRVGEAGIPTHSMMPATRCDTLQSVTMTVLRVYIYRGPREQDNFYQVMRKSMR